MGLFNRTKAQEDRVTPANSSGSDTLPENNEKYGSHDSPTIQHIDDMHDPHTRLHRGLKARQVTMIAIGGAM